MIRTLNLFALVLLSLPLFAQDQPRGFTVRLITDEIQIDGILDEAVWETADIADNFWQFFPTDSVLAEQCTEIRMLYNDHTLYVGIRADAAGEDYVISTLRRDFGGATNDNVTLMFDTFKDGTNAFLFGVTPYGVQREVLISGGGSGGESMNTTWDVKWQVESSMFEDHYILEIAIPFSSLKFREGETEWRFQCYRWDLQSNEQSAWARVPQNQLLINLAFMGDLVFEKPLGKSRTPIAIIPYVNALSQKEFETDEADSRFKVGGDAKVAIGTGMNLDITLNPDFSNVEVDDIFTNLTRFEVLLPEKRQFFIDNSDLFGSFGSIYRDATPFFSRRIGLARDSTNNLVENRIIGGVRLSGKI
ncbi:MAG: hydrolase, partial [Bacteroidetes bacterium]|nr:hydrolase [Bacteroidota bacterium]